MKSILLNDGWTFYPFGKREESLQVDLPYDAMIHEERIPGLAAGDATAYFPGGHYIYEKVLFADLNEKDLSFVLDFDGVYQKANVYVNGRHAGFQFLGYTNFQIDITGLLNFGEDNLITVDVDNSQTPNARWYTGSGIYRDVKLFKGDRMHILPYGIEVKTISLNPAILEIRVYTTVKNAAQYGIRLYVDDQETEDGNIHHSQSVQDENGTIYCFTIVQQGLGVWTEQAPVLHRLCAELFCAGQEKYIDRESRKFGIRTLEWNASQGMCINGGTVKLRGACLHHDNGILGASEYDEIAKRKIRILKECGYNAVRTAHNEPSRALLEACDELGMYVMAEFTDVWRAPKNDFDYALYFDECWEADLTQFVKKCMCYPCVVIYSIGNEVYDTKSIDSSTTCRMMADKIRQLDDSRPITMGFNILGAMSHASKRPVKRPRHNKDEKVDPKRSGKASPLVSSKFMNTLTMYLPRLMERVTKEQLETNAGHLLDSLDLAGLNYGTHLFSIHDINSKRLIINTETFPSQIGRSWPDTVKHSHIFGDFMWTGWDYLGECGVGVVEYGKTPRRLNKPYPCISSGIGSVNLVGEIEAQGYYTKAAYGLEDAPFIAVRPVMHAGEKAKMSNWRGTDGVNSWAWGECYGTLVDVEVFSAYPEVELFQNGSSLGKKKTAECKAEYKITYSTGYLEAVSYGVDGEPVASSRLESAGIETKLHLHAEKTALAVGKKEIFYVFAELTDTKGIRKVAEDRIITVSVDGPAKILAAGSGSPLADLPYINPCARTYYGTMAAAVQSIGECGDITITMKTDRLETASITVAVS